MKNILILLGIALSGVSFGQIIIGQGKNAPSSPSVSLEFGTDAKGLQLPWVDNINNVVNVVDGTMVLDLMDRKVKIKLQSGWKDLSIASTSLINTFLQDGKSDIESAKTSIGTPTNVAGILVLEDEDKAMQLPMVKSPHLSIIDPAPGMIAYDTLSKQVCVFNGSVWSFWKPE